MVTLVDDLAQRELISRTTDPADRRRNLIALTTRGRKLVRQATSAGRRIHRELLTALSPSEQEQVQQLDRALG